jgi:TRAP-type C4-dicarboxylate transport system permease small subunit
LADAVRPKKGGPMNSTVDHPKPAGFFRVLNRAIGKVINGIEVSILVFCVAALGILLIVNVFARTFFQSIYFAEEVSMFLVMLCTFAGVSYGVRKARHIRMGAFLDFMPAKMEKVFLIIISFVSAVVMGIMTWFSYQYLLNAMQMAHMTPALRVPKWTFYVIIPVGFGMACIQYIRTIIKNLIESEPWQSPDQQSEYEDEQIGGAQL